ncbi:MAG: Hsp20/alpha crystallin family protein [Planctomycetaceae bacterium]|jgi:HSP20 family protein|nr:Hsp20/alpha crystallin family protein [Planctomycetaceae bacterium]
MYTELVYPYPFSRELFRRLNQFLSMPSLNETEGIFGSLSSGELATNVWEDEDAFYIEMEVPGTKPEEIDLSIIGTELQIKIMRSHESELKNGESKNGRYLRRERTFGNTVRTITLPIDSAPKELDASIELGVLCVRLRKPEEAKVQKITVSPK